MGKRKKKSEVVVETSEIKIRKPIPKPGFSFKDKKKYDRKLKHKKGWGESPNPFLFSENHNTTTANY